MSPPNTLDIAYVNVRGLNHLAYQSLNNWIQDSTYKIIISSETWFINRNQYLSNSFYLGESTYQQPTYHGRRHDGGLLALIHPSLRQSTTIFYRSAFVIGIKHEQIKLGFIYFPPSLDLQSISTELEKLGSVDHLLGDFNMRLGSISGDNTTTCKDRQSIINNYNLTNHLQYSRNNNAEVVSRTDHVFSCKSSPWLYTMKLPFESDHGIITLQIETSTSHAPSITSPRFDFKPLLNPVFKSEFVSTFDNLYGPSLYHETSTALSTLCYSMCLPTTSASQEIIDLTYSTFIESLTNLAHSSLTRYDAHQVQSSPDIVYSQASINPPSSVSAAIRTFKRSQRILKRNNPIQSSNPSQTPIENCTSHYQSIFDSQEPAPIIERQNDLLFATEIQSESIKDAFISYPNHKTMGSDGLHVLLFKTLTKSHFFLESVTDLFQIFAATSLVPSQWSECNLHLLVKDQTKPAVASNTRPIALSSIVRRIFEKLVLKSWVKSDQGWSQLNFGQAGFRRGYSTLSQLVLSDELSRHDDSFSVFLDIKAAFDSVSWPTLHQILQDRQCPDTALNLIMSLICKPASLLLSVNQSERTTISTRKGVFQGGGISAFVFAIYIDPLAVALNGTVPTHQPSALLYADDIKLNPKNAAEAQKQLDICFDYAIALKIKWNIKKCAIVAPVPVSLTLAHEQLPNADSYKYLGAIHKFNRVDWAESALKATQKQARFMESLNHSSWHPRLKLILYRTFIRPVNEYVLPLAWIWINKSLSTRQSTLKALKTAHENGIKFVFGRARHLKVMDYICGFGSFEFRMECLVGGLNASFNRLKSCNPLVKARSVYCVSSSSHFMLQSCFNSKYLSAYVRAKEGKKLTWKTWKRQKLEQLRIENAKSSALIAYFCPDSKLCDNSSKIFDLPSQSFRLICDWRMNSSLQHRNCKCGSQFRRTHVSCYLSANPIYSSTVTSTSYSRSVSKLQRQHVLSANYSVLDYLLNCNSYDEFLELLNALTALIDS